MNRFFLVNSILLIALLGVVFSGFLKRFAEDGSVDVAMYATSLVVYWAIVNLIVWLVVRQRRKWPQIALVCGSLLFSFAAFELAARMLLPVRTAAKWRHVKSSQFHHIGPPNRRMYEGQYEGTDVLIETNEDGLRTHYSRKDFLKHKKRIAVLGDSFIFGLGVAQDKIVTQKLEELLRERTGEDVAVLNAGFISYSPFVQEILYRKIVTHYRPQIVLQVLDLTDIGDDVKYASNAQQRDDGEIVFPGMDYQPPRYHSAFWNLLNASQQAFVSDVVAVPFKVTKRVLNKGGFGERPGEDYYKLRLEVDGKAETDRFFILRHPLEKTQEYFDATLANIRRLDEHVQADGAQFALVPAPCYFHWNPKECPANWEAFRYKNDEPYSFEYFRYFDEKREELGFPLIDLLEAFRATDEFPLVFKGDAHWNARGHAFVARTLADKLNDL